MESIFRYTVRINYKCSMIGLLGFTLPVNGVFVFAKVSGENGECFHIGIHFSVAQFKPIAHGGVDNLFFPAMVVI